ncbi:YrdB family protein [Microbacterium sp. ARD32]|uniref:YrdB family protein n=1 Tax=Microbacterium sp. ARD32 TaxID=2962577 RepID=UPI002882A0E1|nr:YrdB family protein [Microbacterium sp. ARD32]MDT0157641.1 YrdB family protein [Microbacterium sp. ARD32]
MDEADGKRRCHGSLADVFHLARRAEMENAVVLPSRMVVRHHGTVRESREPAGVERVDAEWEGYASPVRELVMLNALVAFALELAMFVFVAWWAAALDVPWWARVLIALVLVSGLAVLWGAFASPRARVVLPVAGVVAVKVVAFGAAALAISGLGAPMAGVVFAGVAAVSVAVTTFVRARRKSPA